VDEKARARNMHDFLDPPVPRTEDPMAIDGRQEEDHEWPALVRTDVDIGEQRGQGIGNPLQRQEDALLHAADILDLAVARAEESRRVGRDGTILGLNPAREQRVQRPVRSDRPLRLLFVQSGGIEPGIRVAEEAQPQSPRRDRQPRQLDAEDRQAEPDQAAVDATGLAELLPLDR
jgi:hypothetical protein